MLSKPATLLLGIIYEKPFNAYEITKLLAYMNINWWFNVPDSTVYTTLKNLEERPNILKSYLTGISKQDNETWKQEAPDFHVANLERMIDMVHAKISGTKRLLSVIREGRLKINSRGYPLL